MDRTAEFRKLLSTLEPRYFNLLSRILCEFENNLLGMTIVDDGNIIHSNNVMMSLYDSGLFAGKADNGVAFAHIEQIDIDDVCYLILLRL